MSANRLKSLFGNFLIVLADVLSKRKGKIIIDQQTFQKEVDAFMNSYSLNTSNFDLKKFQSDFIKYLKDKNYSCDGMFVRVRPANSDEANKKDDEVKAPPKNIRKISEDLNDCLRNMDMYLDTTKMTAGLVCYTIEQIAPTDKKPYVTYRPDARIITQIHDNGVNGGTIFLTCSHKFIKAVNFNSNRSSEVVSETEVIYTPLTKEHAEYMCKILNAQSRLFYKNQMKGLLRAEKLRQQKTK